MSNEADVEARRVIVYTDGACIGNPGPGGHAAVMSRGTGRRVVKGGAAETTNQRMELMAPIKALESMKTDAPMTIISDSQYLVKGMNDWLQGWKAKGWRNSKKQPVANQDLWERLDALVAARVNGVVFTWTRGHAGNPHNEEADGIANEEALKAAARNGRGS